MQTKTPWTAGRTVLRDADGNSIASGGNNRVITGDQLAEALQLAAKAPDLRAALAAVTDMLEACLPTLKARGWQIHNEQAVVARARKLTD